MKITKQSIKSISKKVSYTKKFNITELRSGTFRITKSKDLKENV